MSASAFAAAAWYRSIEDFTSCYLLGMYARRRMLTSECIGLGITAVAPSTLPTPVSRPLSPYSPISLHLRSLHFRGSPTFLAHQQITVHHEPVHGG